MGSRSDDPSMHDSMTTAERVVAYRSRHTIEATEQIHPRLETTIHLCWTDGIRVHPRRGGGWYHDPTEVRLLTAAAPVIAS